MGEFFGRRILGHRGNGWLPGIDNAWWRCRIARTCNAMGL